MQHIPANPQEVDEPRFPLSDVRWLIPSMPAKAILNYTDRGLVTAGNGGPRRRLYSVGSVLALGVMHRVFAGGSTLPACKLVADAAVERLKDRVRLGQTQIVRDTVWMVYTLATARGRKGEIIPGKTLSPIFCTNVEIGAAGLSLLRDISSDPFGEVRALPVDDMIDWLLSQIASLPQAAGAKAA